MRLDLVRKERAYSQVKLPHWHDVEIEEYEMENTPERIVDEQISWWKASPIEPAEAFEALYGRKPASMTWCRLKAYMLRDFT